MNSLRGGGDIHGDVFKKCNMRYEEVITFKNLLTAWNDFIQGKRKREDVNEFAFHIMDNLNDILFDLVQGVYSHGTYEEYSICDPKKRVIHKASVRDRVLHRLIYNALYNYFDTRYIYDSYSCRAGKGTHKAYARFRYFVNKVSKNYTKPCYILKFDIKKCFESIDTIILKKILAEHIVDIKLLRLIFIVVDSFPKGLPLGNLTSQLFINVYLHELDFYVKQRLGYKYYLRYADDMVFVSQNKKELEDMCQAPTIFLKEVLGLTTHKKVISSLYSGIDVPGLVFFAKYERLRRSTERRAKKRSSGLCGPDDTINTRLNSPALWPRL